MMDQMLLTDSLTVTQNMEMKARQKYSQTWNPNVAPII